VSKTARAFVLPASLDERAAVLLVSDRLDVEIGRPRREERLLLDSFDGRLRAARLRAERSIGSAAVTLRVFEPGAPTRSAEVPPAARHLAAELPDGAVRERLAGVLGVRALLPLVRIRTSVRPLAVLNRDAKTVVRLSLERADVVVRGREPIALAPRVAVQPVLGYDTAFERTVRTLGSARGLAPAAVSLFDEAVEAAGGRAGGVSSKVGVKLVRGARADEAAGAVLGRLADIAEANLPGTLEDLDTEFLHDLRVSIRRSRSVLRELTGVHPPEQRARLRSELRWAQALTGPLRDLDVQLLDWDALTAALPLERAADLDPLGALLTRRRELELARLRRHLRGRRFRSALVAWRALAAALPAPGSAIDRPRAGLPIEALAGARIRTVYRRMARDGGRIAADSPAEALHELRKRGKELRYMLELFGGLFPGSTIRPMIGALKDLQDVLGRFQDRAVQADMLRGLGGELVAEPGGPAALMAMGPALDVLAADQRAARESFAQRFASFASPEQRSLVRDTFPQRARE
jgi:CHAD domain-containing protein